MRSGTRSGTRVCSLDHSVRTVSEARRLASDDIKVVLGLLDARVVAGDAILAEQLQAAVLSDWRAMADRRLPDAPRDGRSSGAGGSVRPASCSSPT